MSFSPQACCDFWFHEAGPERWWKKDPDFDGLICERFGELHKRAAAGELFGWRVDAHGRLAEILVLDQFSRNIYRDDPRTFAQDPMALVLAQEAVRINADMELEQSWRNFFYLPYMHSESAAIHEEAVRLMGERASQGNLDFELRHKRIIDRFGRYPHRNEVLGRSSTPEELEFLKQKGSSF